MFTHKFDIQHGKIRSHRDLWDFYCTHPGHCGEGSKKFNSTGWPTMAIAADRGQQHINEHEVGSIMQPLHEFREDHNLNPDGTVKV